MSLNKDDVALLVSMINEEVSEDVVSEIAERVSFKGFDPLVIFKLVSDKIKSDASVKQALFVMITFGLTRGFGGGKSWQTILEKTNPAGRDLLQNAKDKLNVKLTRPDSEETITIPRLMQVFSFYTYRIYCVLVKIGKVRAFGYTGSLPQQLCWIGSPSCMSASAWRKYSQDYIEFSVYCSNIWNRPQDEDTARRFAELAYSTNTWPREKRLGVKELRASLVEERDEEEEEEIKIPARASGSKVRHGE